MANENQEWVWPQNQDRTTLLSLMWDFFQMTEIECEKMETDYMRGLVVAEWRRREVK